MRKTHKKTEQCQKIFAKRKLFLPEFLTLATFKSDKQRKQTKKLCFEGFDEFTEVICKNHIFTVKILPRFFFRLTYAFSSFSITATSQKN